MTPPSAIDVLLRRKAAKFGFAILHECLTGVFPLGMYLVNKYRTVDREEVVYPEVEDLVGTPSHTGKRTEQSGIVWQGMQPYSGHSVVVRQVESW